MKNKTLIVHPSKLNGVVRLSGAKNSALRLLAASILTDEEITISNFPNGLSDVKIHNEMLMKLGKKVLAEDKIIKISGKLSTSNLIWNGRSIRNTLLILGATLSKTNYARVPLPGGCKIGERKYDLHKLVLEALGAKVWSEGDYLVAKSKGRLIGCEIILPIRSTGATENAIISATLAEGKTIIWNPHIRPEILDLIDMLIKMGAKITVNGSESIVVDGVYALHSTSHRVIPDNMEALTYLIATAIAGDSVEIIDFPKRDLEIPLIFLKSSGLEIFEGKKSIIVKKSKAYPIEISTGPYPGINSDMQPLLAVYAAKAIGTSKIVDLRFPDRFGYAKQLNKMGINAAVENNLLVIKGNNQIKGTNVYADDLRAGAALLIAGIAAVSGQTSIENANQIERGYEDFILKFKQLGAQIYWN